MASNDKQIKISKEGYDSILNKIFVNIQEERDLALDRYRIQDKLMTSPEDFILQGKDAVSFLKVASDRTNALQTLAKEIKEIAYVNELNSKSVAISSSVSSDDERKEMEDFVKSLKKGGKKTIEIKEEQTPMEEEEE